ncbi:MAG: hypothetical protein AB8B51_07595 [Sedimentitalea sp.]
MSSALQTLLEALATKDEPREGGARVLKRRGALLDLIITEISQTVLPVTLRFDSGPSRLSIDVAGRRVHRLIETTGALSAPPALLGAALSMENTIARTALADLMHSFVKTAEHLHVTSTHTTKVTAASGDSLSLSALIKDLGLEPEPDDADMPLFDRFKARAGDQTRAMIQLTRGRITASDGAAPDVAVLKAVAATQIAAFQNARAAACPSHSDPSLTLFIETGKDDHCLGYATSANENLIFSMKSDNYGHVMDAFSRLL